MKVYCVFYVDPEVQVLEHVCATHAKAVELLGKVEEKYDIADDDPYQKAIIVEKEVE